MCNVLEGCPCNETPPAKKPSWDDVEVGDTVSFVVTGEVLTIDEAGGAVANESGEIAFIVGSDVLKSVEKPVRTFSVGDKVRGLDDNNGFFATIVPGGYVLHRNAKYVQTPITFDSLNYELLD